MGMDVALHDVQSRLCCNFACLQNSRYIILSTALPVPLESSGVTAICYALTVYEMLKSCLRRLACCMHACMKTSSDISALLTAALFLSLLQERIASCWKQNAVCKRHCAILTSPFAILRPEHNADATHFGCAANYISCPLQESGLFDAMGGISPEPSAANFGNSAPDMSMSLPMRARYSGEQLQSGPPTRLPSPELQSGHNSFSGWSQSTGRGLLEHIGQNPHQGSTEHAQGVQHATLSAYDDRLWSRQGPSQQSQQPQQPPATTNP